MTVLTAKARHKLPASDFVFPGEEAFPIEDRRHAIAALAYAHTQSPERAAKVRAAVHARYPDLGAKPGWLHGRKKR